MKQKMAMLLVTILVLGLAACSSSDSTVSSDSSEQKKDETFDDYTRPAIVSDGEMSIIYLISNMTDESNIRSERQAAIEAAHRGWDYQVINYEKEDNFREYFQNAINQKPTAIIIGITQAFDSYQDLVASARNAGIGIYSNDNSIIDGVISNSTMDNAEAANLIMEQVIEDHGDALKCSVYELSMSEVMTDRAEAAKAFIESSDNGLTLLDSIDLASTGDLNTAGFTLAQTWLQKYGDDLDFIFCGADTPAMSAAEAISQAGDKTGENTFVAGVDGGSASWNYIRSGTPLKYTYSQPFEYFTHQTFEIISALQIQGLNPGDEGCPIDKAGGTVTATGIVTTVDNVPEVGADISSVFDYYGGSKDDADAWYNWTDGPGIYTVTDSK